MLHDPADTMYVVCHPSQEQLAEGYAAGLSASNDWNEGVTFEVVARDDCKVDRLYLLDKLPAKLPVGDHRCSTILS